MPGLVEATRAGRVSIANALGSGLVESPAFLPFLPGLATHLLGEELQVALGGRPGGAARPGSGATWRSTCDEMLLRPAFAVAGPQARPGVWTMPPARKRSHGCANGRMSSSVSMRPLFPARRLGDGSSRPDGAQGLRAVRSGTTTSLLPGGMARVMDQDALGTFAVAFGGRQQRRLGAAGARPQTECLTHRPLLRRPWRRLASDLPSRTAENLFWLGRYAERLEHLLRICRSSARSLANESANGRPAALAELLRRLRLR